MRPSAEAVPDESSVKLLTLAAAGLPLAGLAASALSRSWAWFYVSGAAGVVLFAGTAFASRARQHGLARRTRGLGPRVGLPRVPAQARRGASHFRRP